MSQLNAESSTSVAAASCGTSRMPPTTTARLLTVDRIAIPLPLIDQIPAAPQTFGCGAVDASSHGPKFPKSYDSQTSGGEDWLALLKAP